jgi:hypothetical protein
MVADRALTPATRLSLGELLPHQQADRTRTPLKAQKLYLQDQKEDVRLSCIIPSFDELFMTLRQVIHVLLTRLPLSQKRKTINRILK